jgi:hypothetical protein
MASVVIHEFEVEVPPESQTASTTPAASSVPEAHMGAQEVECIMRRHKERAARLWAH